MLYVYHSLIHSQSPYKTAIPLPFHYGHLHTSSLLQLYLHNPRLHGVKHKYTFHYMIFSFIFLVPRHWFHPTTASFLFSQCHCLPLSPRLHPVSFSPLFTTPPSLPHSAGPFCRRPYITVHHNHHAMPHSLKPVKYNCLKGSAENLFGLPLISKLSITLKAGTMHVN